MKYLEEKYKQLCSETRDRSLIIFRFVGLQLGGNYRNSINLEVTRIILNSFVMAKILFSARFLNNRECTLLSLTD